MIQAGRIAWFSGPYVFVNINGTQVQAYLDTGAFSTILADDIFNDLFKGNPPKLAEYRGECLDASGNPIKILGKAKTHVITSTGAFSTEVLVYQRNPKMEHHLLIGMNILSHSTIDLKDKKLSFTCTTPNRGNRESCYDLEIEFPDASISGTSRSVLSTHFTDPGQAKAVYNSKEAAPDKRVKEVRPCQQEVPVYLTENIGIPPNTLLTNTTVRVNHRDLNDNHDLVIHQSIIDNKIVMPNIITKIKNNSLKINLANLSNDHVNLLAGTKLCNATHIYEGTPDVVNSVSSNINANEYKDEGDYRPLLLTDIRCDDPDAAKELLDILNRYRSTCWLPGERLGHYTGDKLKIPLKSDVVVNKPPYRIPYALQGPLDEAIDEMLNEGIIAHSKSNYNSPLIIVRKSDGGIRPCLDLRELNKNLVPVSYPLPRINDLLNALGEANVMSTIDLAHAFHQCEIDPPDCMKTAFTVRNSKYEFRRVPFGIQSAPGFFARIINTVLYQVLGQNCLAYLDDLILFNQNKAQHLKTLVLVLDALAKANIKLKVSKCKFFATQIKFLGYRVCKDGMTMEPDRIQAINSMPIPTNKRTLQAFLGVCNYFRIFVRNFANIAEPLYDLLRKKARFLWTERQTQAVNTLKAQLAKAPIVAFPNYKKPFHLHTDASDSGIGAVLMQEKDGILHPLAYVSKTLNQAQRNYSTTKKEALSLVFALEQFRHIILMFPITVWTDHKPLLGALTKPTKDDCLSRWALLIQEYAINLRYLEGKANIFADTLSRLPEPETLELDDTFQNELNERNSFCNSLNEYLPIKLPWSEDKP